MARLLPGDERTPNVYFSARVIEQRFALSGSLGHLLSVLPLAWPGAGHTLALQFCSARHFWTKSDASGLIMPSAYDRVAVEAKAVTSEPCRLGR